MFTSIFSLHCSYIGQHGSPWDVLTANLLSNR